MKKQGSKDPQDPKDGVMPESKIVPPAKDGEASARSEAKDEPIKIVPPAAEETKKKKSEAPLNNSAATQESKESKGSNKPKEQKGKEENASLIQQLADLRQFLKEVGIEFRKISWPEGRQVARETWSVLFLVAIITLMVLGFDWILQNGVFGPLEHWARLHGGGIGHTGP